MLKEAIEKILSLAPAEIKDVGERDYSDKPLHPLKRPVRNAVVVSTLSGFRDLANASLDDDNWKDDVFYQVDDEVTVSANSRRVDEWAQREELLRAHFPEKTGFLFGQFMDPEQFVIGLQSNFETTDDLGYLLATCSNLSTEQVATAHDDGVSQVAALRRGVALKAEAKVRARMVLQPRRTFHEIVQPASEFVFRLRSSQPDRPPQCALFEADGGEWKREAMVRIAGWLVGNLPQGCVIVA